MPSLVRMRGRAGAAVAGGGMPPGVTAAGRAGSVVAWNTQYTAGIAAPGDLIEAAVSGDMSAWGSDSNYWYPPSSGVREVYNRIFRKPIYGAGSADLTLGNCYSVPEATNAAYAIGIEGGSSLIVRLVNYHANLINCGKTFTAGIYQGGGQVHGLRSRIENAPLNMHDMHTTTGISSSWTESYFRKFGCKASENGPGGGDNDHCEPFHHVRGNSTLLRCFNDNLGHAIPPAVVTADLMFQETDVEAQVCNITDCINRGDPLNNAPYVLPFGQDPQLSTFNILNLVTTAGTSGVISKSSNGRLYGGPIYDLASGSVVSASYD